MTARLNAKRLTSLPPKYYEVIGEVMFHWALHDAQMLDILGFLLKMEPKKKRMLLGKLDESAKIKMVKFLAGRDMRPKNPLRKATEQFCKDSQELADRRNQFAHTPWVTVPGHTIPGLLDMGTIGKRYDPTVEIMTDEKIKDTIETFRISTALGELILAAMTGKQEIMK